MITFIRTSPLILFLPLFILNALMAWYISPVPYYPDEKTHFDYVEFIASNGRLPGKDERANIRSRLLKLNVSRTGNYIEGERGITEKLLERAKPEGETTSEIDTIRAISYPPPYYVLGAFLANIFTDTDNLYSFFNFLRIYSLSLWVMTVIAAAFLVKSVFPNDRSLQAWSLAVIGFMPMFVFTGIAVNSDVLATLVMTVIIWQCVKLLKSPSWKSPRILFILVLSVLSASVKPQLIITVLFFAIALLMQQVRLGKKALPAARMAAAAAIIFALGVLAAYAYSAYFKSMYGYSIFSTLQEISLFSWLNYVLTNFWRMFFYPVGIFWGDSYPAYVFFQFTMYLMPEHSSGLYGANMAFISVIIVFIWGGFAGVVWKIVRGKIKAEEAFVIVASLAWWVWIVSLTYLFFDRDTHMQGRYFFPIIAAAVPALICGWDAFPRLFVRLAGRTMILCMIVFLEYEILKIFMLEYR